MRDGFYALGARGKAAHERIFGARGSVAAAQRDGSPGTSPAATLPSDVAVFIAALDEDVDGFPTDGPGWPD